MHGNCVKLRKKYFFCSRQGDRGAIGASGGSGPEGGPVRR